MKGAKVVCLQLIIAVLTALVAVVLGGAKAGISSVLASTSCVVPNMVMFAGFYLNERVLKLSGFTVLFVMEFVKVALTTLLLVAAFWLYRDINWIAFLASFVIALKSYIFLLSRSEN